MTSRHRILPPRNSRKQPYVRRIYHILRGLAVLMLPMAWGSELL